jgi:pyruvate,orthophosphate dikinase
MSRYIYDFDEPSDGGRDLLGGKGVGLAEMTQLGIPVPSGFTITTDASRAYMRDGGIPAGLEKEIDEHIARLRRARGSDSATLRTRSSCRCAPVPRCRCRG